ncbi:putative esterase of the alpha-beta hydrolase superfamily [Trachipleistophora hominis]|uniref:Putative esterase of the alpha-beta hydrolase superfamily n=1 Tax=Trachipleistophora hominis TaxID=72359 RepID=L7JSQ6_TRAHO|nr:putative esterase of the alpha-beta hydrolase superfamily [Trachipleistophora hominis]
MFYHFIFLSVLTILSYFLYFRKKYNTKTRALPQKKEHFRLSIANDNTLFALLCMNKDEPRIVEYKKGELVSVAGVILEGMACLRIDGRYYGMKSVGEFTVGVDEMVRMVVNDDGVSDRINDDGIRDARMGEESNIKDGIINDDDDDGRVNGGRQDEESNIKDDETKDEENNEESNVKDDETKDAENNEESNVKDDETKDAENNEESNEESNVKDDETKDEENNEVNPDEKNHRPCDKSGKDKRINSLKRRNVNTTGSDKKGIKKEKNKKENGSDGIYTIGNEKDVLLHFVHNEEEKRNDRSKYSNNDNSDKYNNNDKGKCNDNNDKYTNNDSDNYSNNDNDKKTNGVNRDRLNVTLIAETNLKVLVSCERFSSYAVFLYLKKIMHLCIKYFNLKRLIMRQDVIERSTITKEFTYEEYTVKDALIRDGVIWVVQGQVEVTAGSARIIIRNGVYGMINHVFKNMQCSLRAHGTVTYRRIDMQPFTYNDVLSYMRITRRMHKIYACIDWQVHSKDTKKFKDLVFLDCGRAYCNNAYYTKGCLNVRELMEYKTCDVRFVKRSYVLVMKRRMFRDLVRKCYGRGFVGRMSGENGRRKVVVVIGREREESLRFFGCLEREMMRMCGDGNDKDDEVVRDDKDDEILRAGGNNKDEDDEVMRDDKDEDDEVVKDNKDDELKRGKEENVRESDKSVEVKDNDNSKKVNSNGKQRKGKNRRGKNKNTNTNTNNNNNDNDTDPNISINNNNSINNGGERYTTSVNDLKPFRTKTTVNNKRTTKDASLQVRTQKKGGKKRPKKFLAIRHCNFIRMGELRFLELIKDVEIVLIYVENYFSRLMSFLVNYGDLILAVNLEHATFDFEVEDVVLYEERSNAGVSEGNGRKMHKIYGPCNKSTFCMKDYERLCRYIRGECVGLVLGGGGARGVAHVGIIEALLEYNVPIDMVGGTSMGAFVGGLYSISMDNFIVCSRVAYFCKRISSRWRLLMDLTIPLCSFFTGHSFNRVLYTIFKKRRIEDTWIQFFCITTNLCTYGEIKHVSGLMWRYIRASMSIATILPPLCDKDALLLDGGYTNNVPVDRMLEHCNRIIAVDVGSATHNAFTPYGDALSGAYILLNKMFTSNKYISYNEIQYRLAFLSSTYKQNKIVQDCNIVLITPDLSYRTDDFDKYREIMSAGYECGKRVMKRMRDKREYRQFFGKMRGRRRMSI